VRQVWLQTVPFLSLLFGVIQWSGTLIEQRKGIVKSTVLERMTEGVFQVSMSVLCLLIWLRLPSVITRVMRCVPAWPYSWHTPS
jgi:hypothetical protein